MAGVRVLTMTEYTGILIGGPDQGNLVTSSQQRIPVCTTTVLRLDGEGLDKDEFIIEKKGCYVWSKENNIFLWEKGSYTEYLKKPV